MTRSATASASISAGSLGWETLRSLVFAWQAGHLPPQGQDALRCTRAPKNGRELITDSCDLPSAVCFVSADFERWVSARLVLAEKLVTGLLFRRALRLRRSNRSTESCGITFLVPGHSDYFYPDIAFSRFPINDVTSVRRRVDTSGIEIVALAFISVSPLHLSWCGIRRSITTSDASRSSLRRQKITSG